MQRLQTVLGLVEKCNILADIGCDHGLLSKQILSLSLADRVIAVDISEPSLNKAKKLLCEYQNVEFYCMDGAELFQALQKMPDVSVICGMGGREIIRIINALKSNIFIVQPQKKADLLRFSLFESGYKILDDVLCFENGKFYDIIKAAKSENKLDKPTKAQLFYGMFCHIKTSLLCQRLDMDEKNFSSYKRTAENIERLKIITEVRNQWQQ